MGDNPVRVNEELKMLPKPDRSKIVQPTAEYPFSTCSDGIYGEASSCYQHVNPRNPRLIRSGAGVRQRATHAHEPIYEGSPEIGV